MLTYLADSAAKAQQLAFDPGITPSQGGLPGLDVLKSTVGSINLFAIIAVVGALCVSGIVWAWGHHTGSHGSEQKGKQGALVAAGAALLLGAANGIVSFFSAVGTNVH
ncbi:DUF6112 family protein [Kitasatospora sp. NPDC057940]|uniref:DUF6112 family protein n=1 Tax=unclassified Kitasatospora TaxID=2633591 RepID=UPI0036AF56B0